MFPCHRSFLHEIERKKCMQALTDTYHNFSLDIYRPLVHTFWTLLIYYLVNPWWFFADSLNLCAMCPPITIQMSGQNHPPSTRSDSYLWRHKCRKIGWRPCSVMSLGCYCDGFRISTIFKFHHINVICHKLSSGIVTNTFTRRALLPIWQKCSIFLNHVTKQMNIVTVVYIDLKSQQ